MAHFRRNQTLLEEMIGVEPQNLRWRLQLLQEYRAIDDYERMYQLGEEGIAMLNLSDAWNGNELQMYIGSFYAAQILSMEGRKDYERMYELCQMAMQDSRNTKLCNTFINEMSAKSCVYRGLAEQIYERAEKQYPLFSSPELLRTPIIIVFTSPRVGLPTMVSLLFGWSASYME